MTLTKEELVYLLECYMEKVVELETKIEDMEYAKYMDSYYASMNAE
jgi:hypothetical protein